MDDRWNVWIWEGRSWRVLAMYTYRPSAVRAAALANMDKRRSAVCVPYDHKRNDYIRAHCKERFAPWNKVM